MTERVCAWCGADISHRKWSAKTCDNICKEKLRHRLRRPDSKPFCEERKCEVCGATYNALTATRRYCGKACRQAAQLEMGRAENAERAKKYRAANPEKYREMDRKRRADDPEKFRERGRMRYQKFADEERKKARERYARNAEGNAAIARRFRAANPERVKAVNARQAAKRKNDPEKYQQYLSRQHENQRRRAAERALAILILDQPPET